MAVIPADIATELGQAAPASGSVTEAQYSSWIARARYLIGKRLGDIDLLDQADVDHVVLLSVARHADNPRGETQVDVAIDDGRVSKRYQKAAGEVTISDDLWALLDPAIADAGAFSVTPTFLPDWPVP